MAAIPLPPIQEPAGTQRWIDWFIKIEQALSNVGDFDQIFEVVESGTNLGDIVRYNGTNWVNASQLLMDAGSVSGPVFTFHEGSTTGMYGAKSGATVDSLHFAIAGVDELSIDGTTTTVKGDLDVTGNADITGTLDAGNTVIGGTLGATGAADFDTSLNVDGETRTETLVVDNNTESFVIQAGAGTPESVVTGNVGDIFVRTDGGTSTVLYIKETGTGNTGWIAK